MIDFEKARITMVDCQVRPNDVTDYAIIDAFLAVPREEFVSTAQKPFAYIDEDIPVSQDGTKRFLMESMSLSKLLQLADIKKDNIVLDIGCATGYSTALISRLCNSVVALESDPVLAEQATKTLTELGYDNTVVVNGALENGGRLVVVEGTSNAGEARLYTNENSVVCARTAFNCAVMPLPGFEKTAEFVF